MIVRNFGDSGGNESDNVALAKLAVVVRPKKVLLNSRWQCGNGTCCGDGDC